MKETRDSAGTAKSSVPRPKRLFAVVGRDVRQDECSEQDGGAAIVELAFVFTLLVMLLVGTVTAAIAFGRNNSIENAAREASRYAATLQASGSATWFTDVRDVARNAALGELDPSVPGQYICVALYNGTGTWTRFTDTGGVPTGPSTGSPCFPDTIPVADQPRVQVVTSRETNINAAVFSVDFTLTGEAAARYER